MSLARIHKLMYTEEEKKNLVPELDRNSRTQAPRHLFNRRKSDQMEFLFLFQFLQTIYLFSVWLASVYSVSSIRSNTDQSIFQTYSIWCVIVCVCGHRLFASRPLPSISISALKWLTTPNTPHSPHFFFCFFFSIYNFINSQHGIPMNNFGHPEKTIVFILFFVFFSFSSMCTFTVVFVVAVVVFQMYAISHFMHTCAN